MFKSNLRSSKMKSLRLDLKSTVLLCIASVSLDLMIRKHILLSNAGSKSPWRKCRSCDYPRPVRLFGNRPHGGHNKRNTTFSPWLRGTKNARFSSYGYLVVSTIPSLTCIMQFPKTGKLRRLRPGKSSSRVRQDFFFRLVSLQAS